MMTSYCHLSCFPVLFCLETVLVGSVLEVLGPRQTREHCMKPEARRMLVLRLKLLVTIAGIHHWVFKWSPSLASDVSNY